MGLRGCILADRKRLMIQEDKGSMRKKSWKRRVVAMMMAVVMVFTTALVSGIGQIEAKAEDGNLLTNGDFEADNLNDWTFSCDGSVSYSVGQWTGMSSKHLILNNPWVDANSKGQEVKVTQTIGELAAGTYELSVSMAGTVTTGFNVIKNGAVDNNSWTANGSTGWNDFKTYTLDITVDTDQREYVIGLDMWLSASNDKSILLDDISLVKKVDSNPDEGGEGADPSEGDPSTDDDAENLFTGLDASLTGWTCSNSSAVYSDGNITLSSTSGEEVGFYQTINTVSGKKYTVKVLAKSGSTHCWVNAYINGKSNDYYVQATSSGAELTFDITGNGEEQKIGISAWIPSGDSCVIEKLLLTKEPDEEVDTSDAVPANIKIDKISDLPSGFIKGVDVSSYISEKESGVKYYDFDGNELDDQGFFNLLASCGVNYVRIRVWHNPYDENGKGYGGGTNDLEKAKKIGKWASDAGMKVLIDFHYSDFWTDPGKQYVPKAWQDYTVDQKAAAITQYTTDSLTALINAGVNVGMVQVGNETNAYFCGEKDWANICKLFSAGCAAVRAVEDAKYGNEIADGSKILIALHFADPQTSGRYAEYAKNLNTNGVDYDVFASSYYPFFHGETSNLTAVLKNIADTYGKKVMVAETSWATTLEDGDGHDNQIRVGNNDTPHYEFSVLGQATEVRTVMKAVVDAGTNAIGVFYWEPAWIPVQYAYDANGNLNQSIRNSNMTKWETYGSGWASSYAGGYQVDAATWYGGSAMDNQAMFDMYGHPLESLKVFNYVSTGTYITQKEVTSATVESVETTLGEDIKSKLGQAKVGLNDTTTMKADVSWNTEDLSKAQNGGVGKYKIRGTVTVDVDGNQLSKAVSCIVTVLPYNYMPNYSLEGTNTWTFSNEKVAIKADGNARTGSNALKFYSESAFDYEAETTVTIEKSGVYKFGGYIQGGDVGDNAKFTYSVSVNGGEPVTVTADPLKGWKTWIDVSVPNVKITGNNTVVTIKVAGTNIAAEGWGSWDDFYINEVTDPAPSNPSGGSSISGGSSGGSSSGSSSGGSSGGAGSATTPSVDTVKNPDATTTETKTETTTNEAGNDVKVTVTTEKDKDGNITGSSEVSVIEKADSKTSATVTVSKNADGKVTEATADVTTVGTTSGKNVVGSISGKVVSQITEAAGAASVEITVNVTGSKGKTKYTLTADSEDLTAGNKLKVVAVDTKTGEYVLVNAKTYTVTKSGNVKVTLASGKNYELLNTKDAAAVEKAVLATVKTKKSSATVKVGKSTTVQLSSKLNMDNVAKITYSTGKKSVATVNKNGKVTAKKEGIVTIKAKVTLNNGKTKTVSMKIKVK